MSTVSERLRKQRTVPGRLAFEALLVIAGAAGVALLVGVLAKGLPISSNQMQDVLAVLTVGAGGAAVGLGHTAGRLVGNRRAAWLIPALALYCIAIVPAPMLVSDHTGAVACPRPGMLIAFGMVGALLLAAIRPPSWSSPRVSWALALGAAGLALVIDSTGAAFPLGALGAATPLSVNLAVLALWLAISMTIVVAGYRGSSAPVWRIGLGFAVLALAHLYRVARPDAVTELDLTFAATRAFGVFVVLLAMSQLLRRVLTLVVEERFAHQEELRSVAVRAEDLARVVVESDHELRNGLTGLTGMTKLLDSAEAIGSQRTARAAVIHELERLNQVLDRRGARASRTGVYDAAQIVRELVALWTVAGLRIESVVPGDLMVLGRAATLAQVMANLLANCSRHAPRSTVQVTAAVAGDVIRVEVRDDGPGPGGTGRPGMGIGLLLCRRILGSEFGNLNTGPAGPDGCGFVATIDLKAVAARPDRDHEPSTIRTGLHR
jgi:two-component system OmpR family sensor kinase